MTEMRTSGSTLRAASGATVTRNVQQMSGGPKNLNALAEG